MPLLKRKHNSVDKQLAKQYKLECLGEYDPNVSNDHEIDRMMSICSDEEGVVFVRNFRAVAEHAYESKTLATSYAYACQDASREKLPKQITLKPTELDYKLAELFVEGERLADVKYKKESEVVHQLCMDVYVRFASCPEGRALEAAKKESLKQIEHVRHDLEKHEQFGKVGYFLMNLALFIATLGISLCFTGGQFNHFKTSNHERLDDLSAEIQTLIEVTH
jgi:hypothetical protein